MKRTSLATAAATSLYALVLALPSPAALAVNSDRTAEHTASGMCVPATFTVAQVRNRPSGVRNESNNTLYVTCSEAASWSGTGFADKIYLQVANFSGVSTTVNCTMFTGYPTADLSGSLSQGTYPMSTVLAASSQDYFIWDSNTLTGSTYNLRNPSWSCSLPPGAEVRATWRSYHEDVGL